MKYGVVTREEWKPSIEGYPDDTVCIVFLTNDGSIAPDEVIENVTGMETASGHVWQIRHDGRRLLGLYTLPMDIEFRGAFNTEQEAVEYAEREYTNDTVALETDINAEITRRHYEDVYIDTVIERKNIYRILAMLIAILLIVLILIGINYILRHTGAFNAPLPTPILSLTGGV
jgi:hypothetical protein